MLKNIIYFIIIINLFSINCIAESGSIIVTDSESNSWTQSPGITVSLPTNDTFIFDVSTYNTISVFRYNHVGITCIKESMVSTFTISSGGSGNGYVQCVKPSNQLEWYFSTDTLITSSPFTLTYGDNTFWDNVTYTNSRSHGLAVSSSKPIFMNAKDGLQVDLTPGTTYYSTTTGQSVENSYSVTYPQAGKFVATIDKSDTTINTLVHLNGSSTNYFSEKSYNNDNFVAIKDYNDGLWINVTTSSGGYNNVLVNYTGSGTPLPFPNATEGEKGLIAFDKTTYTIGDIASITWDFAGTYWNNLYYRKSISIERYYEGNTQGESLLMFPGKNGVYHYDFHQGVGNYKVILRESALFGLAPYKTIDYDECIVMPRTSSYLFVNSSYPSKTLSNVTYHIGYPFNNLDIRIVTKKLVNNEYIYEHSFFIANRVDYNQSVYFESEGKYAIVLEDIKRSEILDTKMVDVYFIPPIDAFNISLSNITIDKNYYYWSDAILFDYEIDINNYTTYPIYIDVYNLDKGISTANFYDIVNTQIGTQKLIVIENILPNTNFPPQYFYTGNNILRLMGKTGYNTSFLIANSSVFTISELTTSGFSMIVTPSKGYINQEINVKLIVPYSTTLKIFESKNNKTIQDIKVNGSKTLKLQFSRTGYYSLLLFNNVNEVELMQNVEIVYKESEIAPITKNNNERVVDMLSNTYIYALVLIALLFLGGASSIGIGGAIMGTGIGIFVSYGMEWIALESVFIGVLAMIIGIAFWLSGRGVER